MLSQRLKNAWYITSNTLFYNTQGQLSLAKCAIVAMAAFYFTVLNPMMFFAIMELLCIFFTAYIIGKLIMSLFTGALDRQVV